MPEVWVYLSVIDSTYQESSRVDPIFSYPIAGEEASSRGYETVYFPFCFNTFLCFNTSENTSIYSNEGLFRILGFTLLFYPFAKSLAEMRLQGLWLMIIGQLSFLIPSPLLHGKHLLIYVSIPSISVSQSSFPS